MAEKKGARRSLKSLATDYEAVEHQIVKNDKLVDEKIDADMQARIVRQVDEEYDVSWELNESKRKISLARLKLYNNQRRDKKAIGDPLMFTIFNTIHAALYVDRLQVSFEGRAGDTDEDIEENLNDLAKFDYTIMQKNQLDYFWNWDAEFFGRSFLLMMEFNRTKGIMAPAPELIDAVSFIRDPRAKSVNGYDLRGSGAMRFGGWEFGMTYYEMKANPSFFNFDALRKDKETFSLMDEAKQARDEAQGRQNTDLKTEALGKFNNYEFQLINWLTTIKGNKYLLTLGNKRRTLVRMVRFDERRWPIEDRVLYPMSQDWDGVSVPDFTEDKQRARSVLANLGLKSAIIDSLGQYVYDSTRIKSKNQINWRRNKFIRSSGSTKDVMVPVQKSIIHQYTTLIQDALSTAAERALATPEIQQGVPSNQQRTLGEIELVASKVDTRYSMNAKVYGWSEAAFWRRWYMQYKKHFKDKIDKKIVRISGPLAPIFKPLKRDNIISEVDPDVSIESTVISEGKRIRERDSFFGFAGLALQDPDTNRRYVFKKMAKLNGATKEEIDIMFPRTIQEIQAEDENEIINNDGLPSIDIMDDHLVHIEIHAKANQNAYSIAHVGEHKKLGVVKKARVDIIPQEELGQIQPGTPQVTPGVPVPPAPTTPTT